MKLIKEGDIVRHTRAFLRSAGWYTAVPRNGKVTAVVEGGPFDGSVFVEWSDSHSGLIRRENIELCPRARGSK